MSRTFRNPNTKNLCLKKPKTHNYLLGNQKAVDELVDAGYSPRNRETAKANPKNIPNAWDDKPVSAINEINYAGGKIWEDTLG